MEDMKTDLSIIFITYNSDDFIFKAIESVIAQNKYNHKLEIIVTDNSPVANIDVELKKYDSENISTVFTHNPANGGYGQGANIAVSKASSEKILFLNPDVRLIEPIFHAAVEKLEEDPKKIVGFTLLDENDYAGQSYGILPEYYYLNWHFNRLHKKDYYSLYKKPFWNKRIWVSMAALGINKQAILDAGGFDETMFLNTEEADLFKRIPDRKVEVLSETIFHAGGHSLEGMEWRTATVLDSLKHYFDKYDHSWALYKYYNLTTCNIKRLVSKVRGKQNQWNDIMIEELTKR